MEPHIDKNGINKTVIRVYVHACSLVGAFHHLMVNYSVDIFATGLCIKTMCSSSLETNTKNSFSFYAARNSPQLLTISGP